MVVILDNQKFEYKIKNKKIAQKDPLAFILRFILSFSSNLGKEEVKSCARDYHFKSKIVVYKSKSNTRKKFEKWERILKKISE